jgi:hypothetical protein
VALRRHIGLVAAVLAHEQVHNSEVGEEGERAASRIEADFLRSRMGSLPPVYRAEARKRLLTLEHLAAREKGRQP